MSLLTSVYFFKGYQYAAIVSEYLNGPLNASFAWNGGCGGPDVIFGGGAEQFIAGPGSPNGSDFYKAFQAEGYNVVYDKTGLQATEDSAKTLGIFSIGNMAKWYASLILLFAVCMLTMV
jgi:alkaline phosphatase